MCPRVWLLTFPERMQATGRDERLEIFRLIPECTHYACSFQIVEEVFVYEVHNTPAQRVRQLRTESFSEISEITVRSGYDPQRSGR